jgi:membrane-bound metal-dependent hydrolase YbcI (DUF457 family)
MGYAIYRIFGLRLLQRSSERFGFVNRDLALSILLSLLPDVDSILGILTGNFGRFHNNITHSLFVGVGVAMIVGGLISILLREKISYWFLIALLCYELHVIMDYFTVGRGILALWPFSPERYRAPIKFFYGLHWSNGLYTLRHLWTFFTETAFALALVAVVRYLASRKKYKPIA